MSLTNVNIAMVIEYDGSGFYGFQKQSGNVRTVQSVLENALSKFTQQEEVHIINAGRTDSGVHATYQVINFFTPKVRDTHKWLRGVNSLLPRDVVVKSVISVPLEFNARYSAVSRTYSYFLLATQIRPAVLYKKVGWYYQSLDILNMQAAIQLLLGQHDFSSFRASDCQALTAIRNITFAEVAYMPSLYPDMIKITITANAFLYHMVRNIVGALVYVGNGTLSVANFAELVKKCDRKLAPPTFMADGLYFTHVQYPEHFKIFYKNK